MIEIGNVIVDITVKNKINKDYICVCNDCGKEFHLNYSNLLLLLLVDILYFHPIYLNYNSNNFYSLMMLMDL